MKKFLPVVLLSVFAFFSWGPVISMAASFFTVDDAGNVGIGNSTPQHALDVTGAMYSRLATTSSSVNWDLGNVQTITLTSSPTLTFSNAQAGGKYDLIVAQDGTGSRTVTWPASVKWPGGSAPTLTSTANATDTVSFIYDGSNYLGTYALDYSGHIPVTLFSDDFNRANSGSVGNGWSVASAGSGSSSGINSNRGFISWDQNGGSTAYRSGISPSGAFYIRADVNFSSNHAAPFEISYKGSAANPASGYGVMLNNLANTLTITDNGSTKASTSFTWGTSATWAVEIDYSAGSQNWVDVYVWDSVSGSKPGTPTLSFHNSNSNYSPSASGSNFSWGGDNADSNVTAYISLFEVVE